MMIAKMAITASVMGDGVALVWKLSAFVSVVIQIQTQSFRALELP